MRLTITIWLAVCFVLVTGNIFGQKAGSNKLWHSIGCLYDEFIDEGLTESSLGNSFSGAGLAVYDAPRKYSSADINSVVQEVAAEVSLNVDVLYTDITGHKLAAYREKKNARDGSIVIELAYLRQILAIKGGLDFFRAIVAHELGHILIAYGRTPIPISLSTSFMSSDRIFSSEVSIRYFVKTASGSLASKQFASYDSTELRRLLQGKVLSINPTLKEEMICDVWAGFITFEPMARSAASEHRGANFGSHFLSLISKWRDLGDDEKLSQRTHGAPLTRGLLFGAGFTGRSELSPYGARSIEIVSFDDKGSLLMWFKEKEMGYFKRFRQDC